MPSLYNFSCRSALVLAVSMAYFGRGAALTQALCSSQNTGNLAEAGKYTFVGFVLASLSY